MTPRVPLWKCRNCRRFHGFCPLEDLDPCDYLPKKGGVTRFQVFLFIVITLVLVVIFLGL